MKDGKEGPHGGAAQPVHTRVDPALAVGAVQGFALLAEPRRKPWHFGALARSGTGERFEFHVELDGTIRKAKPVGRDERKWAADVAASDAPAGHRGH